MDKKVQHIAPLRSPQNGVSVKDISPDDLDMLPVPSVQLSRIACKTTNGVPGGKEARDKPPPHVSACAYDKDLLHDNSLEL
jgi:hypothetical protein